MIASCSIARDGRDDVENHLFNANVDQHRRAFLSYFWCRTFFFFGFVWGGPFRSGGVPAALLWMNNQPDDNGDERRKLSAAVEHTAIACDDVNCDSLWFLNGTPTISNCALEDLVEELLAPSLTDAIRRIAFEYMSFSEFHENHSFIKHFKNAL